MSQVRWTGLSAPALVDGTPAISAASASDASGENRASFPPLSGSKEDYAPVLPLPGEGWDAPAYCNEARAGPPHPPAWVREVPTEPTNQDSLCLVVTVGDGHKIAR